MTLRIKKTKKQEIGNNLIRKESKRKIGIIGAGVMGTGIAQTFVSFGFKVILIDKNPKALNLATQKIRKELLKTRHVIGKNRISANIKPTNNLNDLKNVDIVVEAIFEDAEAKKYLFKQLNGILTQETIITTNTSSLSIDELSTTIINPERFIGVHFFNPPLKMKLVEVIRSKKTSEATIQKIDELLRQINKMPIIIKDSPGFIVNRILMPYLNEAIWEFYEGIATAEDIDTAAKFGLNHPMGPLALADLIGLDIVLTIMNNLYQKTRNSKYLPCPIIKKMVKEGKLGRKTKEGFYKY